MCGTQISERREHVVVAAAAVFLCLFVRLFAPTHPSQTITTSACRTYHWPYNNEQPIVKQHIYCYRPMHYVWHPNQWKESMLLLLLFVCLFAAAAGAALMLLLLLLLLLLLCCCYGNLYTPSCSGWNTYDGWTLSSSNTNMMLIMDWQMMKCDFFFVIDIQWAVQFYQIFVSQWTDFFFVIDTQWAVQFYQIFVSHPGVSTMYFFVQWYSFSE